jgi:hypothetical protein
MSLTSYQAAPPRVVSISIETTKIKSKLRFETTSGLGDYSRGLFHYLLLAILVTVGKP